MTLSRCPAGAALALVLVAACTAAMAPALAATPEDDYFAARDAAIVRMTAAVDTLTRDQYIAENDKVEAGLGAQLQAIVGPVAVKGFSGPPRLNTASLVKGDIDFGRIDGLLFSAPGATDATLVVTTETIANHWLGEHKALSDGADDGLPQTLPAALRADAFYTQALSSDAAASIYAELPVKPPVGASLVFAAAIGRSQDQLQPAPNEIVVTVVTGGRVFMVSTPARTTLGPIAACSAITRAAAAKVRALQAKPVADPDGEKAMAAEREGDKAFLACYRQKAPMIAGKFKALTAEAQALVAALPAK